MDRYPSPTLPVASHRVFNQTPSLAGMDPYTSNLALRDAVAREGAGWAEDTLGAFGRRVASAEVLQWAEDANRHPPVVHTHDRHGRRLDQVDFHPAWHRLMALSIEHGLHGLHWQEARAGVHVVRAALVMLMAETEYGHLCPVSMTSSAVPVLRRQPEVAAIWEPRILSRTYDPTYGPAEHKRGALIGMAMTEKQGGSDVRANTTRAERLASGGYRLTGHKWFCSAPMSDAFLVLAQAEGGLSCFLVPRFCPDGERNRFFIQRLKDKLGNRSNASSEIELHEAFGQLLGEEGRGVHTIIEMVNHTRLDCALSAAAIMRQGLVQALHHARFRSAFGARLVEQPLMRAVLADLALEAEAATLLAMRLARTYEGVAAQGPGRAAEAHLQRVLTAVAKYWLSKRSIAHVAEALEVLGGNGYTEDFPMARLYREAPLNSIWEGSGNVICLDVLRALQRSPDTADALLAEVERATGADPRLDRFTRTLREDLAHAAPAGARRLVERIALSVCGALVVRHTPPVVADAFCASRLAGDWGQCFGTLSPAADTAAILARALPE